LLGSGELYDPEIGNVEDAPLKPMVICETETRMEKRSRLFEGIRNRNIAFKGDARGISTLRICHILQRRLLGRARKHSLPVSYKLK